MLSKIVKSKALYPQAFLCLPPDNVYHMNCYILQASEFEHLVCLTIRINHVALLSSTSIAHFIRYIFGYFRFKPHDLFKYNIGTSHTKGAASYPMILRLGK